MGLGVHWILHHWVSTTWWSGDLGDLGGTSNLGRHDILLVKRCWLSDPQRAGLVLMKHSLLLTAEGIFLTQPDPAPCAVDSAEWREPSYCCSATKSCPTLGNPMDCSTPGFPVLHSLLELAQTHVHWAGDAIQPSHPLLPPSPLTFNLSQHQGLFQWGSSSHQVAKVLELQLQHQSFQWILRVDFL